ncbi:hypothetical protein HK405_011450, partial [Cladochytrium tenue]
MPSVLHARTHACQEDSASLPLSYFSAWKTKGNVYVTWPPTSMQQQHHHTQPGVVVVELSDGALLGFKALPVPWQPELPASGVRLPAAPDWAALYPQLTLARAAAYLGNQWERAPGHACQLAALRVRRQQRRGGVRVGVVVGASDLLTAADVDAREKARVVREALRASGLLAVDGQVEAEDEDEENGRGQQRAVPLMEVVAQAGLACLCLPDADGWMELAVPHSRTGPDNIDVLTIFSMEEGRRPFTVGNVTMRHADGADVPILLERDEREDLGESGLGRRLATEAVKASMPWKSDLCQELEKLG